MQPEAPPEVRKMAQPVCAPPRRGSGGGAAGPSLAGPPLGMGDEGPSAASSPVPQQQPPQSLSLLGPGGGPPAPAPQPQLGPKKKSGFQITSVTPAQASASLSSNNSIAEDTESYDDLDESHTEDLSSSEILDASLSRATDLGAPGRSSSEETLSNLQEAETPGALSPNQPRLPGLPPPQQPPLLNGILGPQEQQHHHHHQQQHHHHHPAPAANVNMMNNQNPATAPHHHPITQAAQAVAAAVLGSAVGQQQQHQQQPPPHQAPTAAPPVAATATSRFRVVKLDSSSEPFRKGRWTCTEYYEREPPACEPSHRAVESVRQAEVGGSERESTSESSVSSTLSHYTESAGSGEGVQASTDPAPQSHPQDPAYGGQHKAAFQPPAPAVSMHQHPYSPQVQPVQTLPQIHYAAQQQNLPAHLPPGHGMAPTQTVTGSMTDYVHPPVMQASIPLVQSGHNPQQHMQSTAAQAQSSVASALPTTAHATTLMPAAAPSTQSVGVVPPMNLPSAVQQPPTSNQGMSSALQHSAAAQPTQLVQGPQSGIIQQGMQRVTSGLPPQVLIPQNTPLPAKPQPQGLDPMLQGMPNQQMPAISPIPPSATVPSMATSAGLLSAPAMAQPSTVHNGAQGVTHITASLPGTHHVPHQIPLNSAQFFPPSLIQSVANQIADARRLMEHSVSGLPQGIMAEGISGMGVSSGLDGSGSITGTGQLLPLKTLPLSTPLVDGEDESSSGASVVAIDNKIEQAMDLVKSHLMYAVREEVEVLKEQIKELIEKNSQLEQENSLLKTLASPEQMAQFQAQLQTGSSPASTQPPAPPASGPPGTA